MLESNLRPSTKLLIGIIIAVTLLGGVYIIWQQQASTSINSFDKCVEAGNPVMETYPEQCIHKGRLFTKDPLPR